MTGMCANRNDVITTLAQLRSSHCWLLNSYKACITAGMTDVCLDCGVAPHSVEHLFQCPACPMQWTTRDLWDDPDTVADFQKLDDSLTKEGSCGLRQQQQQQQQQRDQCSHMNCAKM